MALENKSYPFYVGGATLPTSNVVEGALYFSDQGNDTYVISVGQESDGYKMVTTKINTEPGASSASTINKGDSIEYAFSKVQARLDNLESEDAGFFTVKGTLGTGGTVTSLPEDPGRGDAYRVITAGTYGDHVCEVDDWIICSTRKSGDTAAIWVVLQGNIDVEGMTFEYSDKALTISIGGTSKTATIPASSTEAVGLVQLNDTVTSSSTTQAATANAVKTAYDKADEALPKAGGTVSGDLAVSGTLKVTGKTTLADIEANDVGFSHLSVNTLGVTSTSEFIRAITCSDTVTASEFIGKVKGDVDGNASSSSNASFAAKIGKSTDSTHTVGGDTTPVYVASDGTVKACTPYASATVAKATNADNATSATTASKIGTATKGNEYTPIYLSAGTPTQCKTFSGVYSGASFDTATKELVFTTLNGNEGDRFSIDYAIKAGSATSAESATSATTADKATKINTDSSIGGSTTPVYIKSDGTITKCTSYSEASVKSATTASTCTGTSAYATKVGTSSAYYNYEGIKGINDKVTSISNNLAWRTF